MNPTSHLDWNTGQGFERLFRELYSPLYRYACGILSDEMQSEEVVQDVFMKLWQQREQLAVTTNMQAYLYRAVHNQAVNILNRAKVEQKYQQFARHRAPDYEMSPAHRLQAGELQQRILRVLAAIPEKCRTIFHLSRQEELSYREIAEKLGLSVKTVENQMSKALKILRAELKDYLPMLAGWITFLGVFFKN